MPPKGGGGRPPLVTASQSPPGHFSIASVFDAATARRNGGPYHFDTAVSPSHPTVTSSRINYASSSNVAGLNQQHWSSSSSSNRHDRHHHGETEDLPQPGSAASLTSDVSSTLQELQSRIVRELEESQQGSREAASKLHAHRQRAMRVAFGEEVAKTSPQRGAPPGSSRAAAASSGAAPSTARASPKDDDDEELLVSSVEFSLLCPYSRLPMRYPVRSKSCNHLQCCDLESWIVMLDKCRSMRDPVGPCPVCERRVIASSLEVDVWMKNVMDQMPSGTHMVVLDVDGTFRNGDMTRERRREQMVTEVVDATQGDYENYLGEVVDDDDGGVVVVQPGPSPVSRGTSATIAGALSAVGSRRPRSPSPELHCRAGASGAAPLLSVKQEAVTVATAAGEGGGATPLSPSSQDDTGVVIIHFVEGHHDGLQALPSQVRLWVPHCRQCGAPRVKAEDGSVEGCPQCGQNEKESWTLVRRFEETPTVSMELMPDGTLVLRGVDLIAPYLYRAGFHRSFFDVMEHASGAQRQQHGSHPPRSVWVTSFPLSRFEIDFLEACCTRIAQGGSLDEIDSLIVPGLFRIPRRRRPGVSSPYNPSQQGGRFGGATTASVGGYRGAAGTAFAQ